MLKRGVETQILAHALQPVRELWAAQPGIERTRQRLARARHDRVGNPLLLRRHLLERYRPHAVAGMRARSEDESGESREKNTMHGFSSEVCKCVSRSTA